MKLAFFGYAWGRKEPDAYMAATIDSFVQAGADVDVYLGQQLAKEFGIYGLKEGLALGALENFMAGENYDAAISFNNSMLVPAVLTALRGRVVSVLVDEPEHLFDYHRTGPMATLKQDIEIVAMSSAVERRIVEAIPGVEPRLHFMLPATHLRRGAPEMGKTYPISWVASFVGDLNLDQYLRLIADRADYRDLTLRCLDALSRHGNLKTITAIEGQDMALIRALPWSLDYFQSQLLNILTNRGRVEIVERLAPHGLALFGNQGWHKLMTYNGAVMQALQSGPPPTTHEELRRIYDASRISINAPQAHTANGAVQYRVIDVMASQALMITRRDPKSDLYRLFGEDCPVPTYESLEELEQLCAHYLAHEKERRALVQQCNALLSDGFDFQGRARHLLRIAGLEPPTHGRPGSQRRIDLDLFLPDA